MKCKKCGQEIEEGLKTCLNCGSAVDFEPMENLDDQVKLIESMGKKRKKIKNPIIFVIGILLAIAGIFVTVSLVFAGNEMRISELNSADKPVDYEAMKARQHAKMEKEAKTSETTTISTEITTYDPEIYYTMPGDNDLHPFPLLMTAFIVTKSGAGTPQISMKVFNSSDTTVTSFAVRIIAYDKNDQKIILGSQNMGQIDKTFNVRINPQSSSENIEFNLSGYTKATKIYYRFLSAKSSDGYENVAQEKWGHNDLS